MSTVMGLDYLYLTTTETTSAGVTNYIMNIDSIAIKNALGLECTQIPADSSVSQDTAYPYKFLIHSANDNQNGVVLRMNSGKTSMDIKSYVGGVLNYTDTFRQAVGISNSSQPVLYYKKGEDFVIFGISQTALEPRINIAYLDYQELGKTEKQKCFLLCSSGSSDAGKCILSDGNVYTFSRRTADISNDIVGIYPLINLTRRIVFPKAFISAITNNNVNTNYFVFNGAAYITFQNYSTTDYKICIQVS